MFQEYYQCCMLPWGVVHHKDPVRKGYCNNMIWNLEGMMRSKHTEIHNMGNQRHRKDLSGRRCSNPNCKNPIKIYYNDKGKERWLKDGKGGFNCQNCYQNKKYHSRDTG
jgi:hypothetical protein